MKPLIFLVLFLMVSVMMVVSCENRPLVVNPDLESNKRKWVDSKIVDYDFEVTKDHGNWMPSNIRVKGGKAVSKQPLDEKGELGLIEEYDDFETVEKIFDSIQNFYNKEYRVEVKYNESLGYPERVLFDHGKSTDSVVIIGIRKFDVR